VPPAIATGEPAFDDEEGAAIWDRVAALGWYHTIELGHGVVTPGFVDNRSTVDLFGLPEDLSGKRCLDIGTYDGFWAFEMERRGASEVIGIDLDSPLDYDMPRLAKQKVLDRDSDAPTIEDDINAQLAQAGMQLPGAGFRLAKEVLGSKAERVPLNVYDVSPERLGTFDVVLISQLLVRLRDPQTAIENMFSVAREIAIVAEGYDEELERLPRAVSEFVGTERVGAWWGHSIKSLRKMMEVAGFAPIDEVARFRVTNKAGSFAKVVLRGHVPGLENADGDS
jgi:tRNA (mo5U34)-methyltransferase